jgi:hypothetical protein
MILVEIDLLILFNIESDGFVTTRNSVMILNLELFMSLLIYNFK